jgi:hypothetical protein
MFVGEGKVWKESCKEEERRKEKKLGSLLSFWNNDNVLEIVKCNGYLSYLCT